jgi:transposase
MSKPRFHSDQRRPNARPPAAIDRRQRVLALASANGANTTAIAEALGLKPLTVQRIIKELNETGALLGARQAVRS